METKTRKRLAASKPSDIRASSATKSSRRRSSIKSSGRSCPTGAVRTEPSNRPSIAAISSQSQLLSLLQSDTGATMAQMMRVNGWQAHSIRGYISGVLRKKLGLVVVLERHESGERRYRIRSPLITDDRHDSRVVTA